MRAVIGIVVLSAIAHAEPSIDDRSDAFEKAYKTGDSFPAAVARATELFGKPKRVRLDKDQAELGWALEEHGACWVILLRGQGGYLTSEKADGTGTGTDGYVACHAKAALASAAVPKLAEPPPIETDAALADFAAAYATGNWKAIWEATDDGVRANVGSPAGWAHFASWFSPLAGKLVKLGTPTKRVPKNFGWELVVPAVFEKGTLELKIAWRHEGDRTKIVDIDLKLPPALQKKPVLADAAALGKRATEILVGGDFARFVDLMALALQVKVAGHERELADQLVAITAKLGRITAVTVTKQDTCRDGQCLELAVTGTKATTKATITAGYMVSRWEVAAFHVDEP